MKGKKWLTAAVLSALLLSGGQVGQAEGTAPVVENREYRTFCNVSVGGTLAAMDPDEDLLRYAVTTGPVKGSLTLSEDGSFLYTPGENRRGRDYFGYRAVDREGNLSQEATVIIRIEKQKKPISYWDMKGDKDEYAALVLSEYDLFTGEQVGGQYSFSPERTVSRGEFLSMCMLLTGQEVSTHVLTTGYADDAQIPDWMKGYVAAASALGLVMGESCGESGSVFDANSPILRSEAEELLDRTLKLENVSYPNREEELSQACMNLLAFGVIEKPQTGDAFLTRIEAARMLSGAIALLEKR